MATWMIIVLVVVVGVLFCACLTVANYAGESYYERFQEFKKVRSSAGITVLQFFGYVNEKFFANKIKIYKNPNEGFDAYAKGAIYLSPSTLSSDNLASFAIVAHELGHGLQDQNTKKIKHMNRLRKTGYIIGPLMFPLIIAGIVLLIIGGGLFYWGVGLASAGAMIFVLSIVIKAITISLEKEASKNAVTFLKELFSPQEVKQCKKFLNDAKLTYWGDMFRALFAWTLLTRKNKFFK